VDEALDAAEARAAAVLAAHQLELDALTAAIIERRRLDGAQLEAVLASVFG
jgi:hypothetical protein